MQVHLSAVAQSTQIHYHNGCASSPFWALHIARKCLVTDTHTLCFRILSCLALQSRSENRCRKRQSTRELAPIENLHKQTVAKSQIVRLNRALYSVAAVQYVWHQPSRNHQGSSQIPERDCNPNIQNSKAHMCEVKLIRRVVVMEESGQEQDKWPAIWEHHDKRQWWM